MVAPVSGEVLQSLATPSIDPNNIFQNYMRGRDIRNQQEEFSIRKELASIEKKKFDLGLLDRERSIENDIEDRQMKRTLYDQDTKINDLNIELKKHEQLGGSSVGILELIRQDSNPQNFAENYSMFRESASPTIRPMLPERFESVQQAKAWAMGAASQADKAIPYLQTLKQGAATEKWQFDASLLMRDPNELSSGEKRYVEHLSKNTGINIHMPSGKSAVEDTVMTMQGIPRLDGEEGSLLDSLDKQSKAAVISRVSSVANMLVAKYENSDTPLDRATAVEMATKAIIDSGEIVKADSITNKLPFMNKTYVYKKLLTQAPELTGTPAADKGIIERGGYLWDTTTNPPTNLGKAK